MPYLGLQQGAGKNLVTLNWLAPSKGFGADHYPD